MAKDILCAFGVDVDAVAGWLGSYGGEDSPDDISRGMFAGEVGVPRLLELFRRHDLTHDLVLARPLDRDLPRAVRGGRRRRPRDRRARLLPREPDRDEPRAGDRGPRPLHRPDREAQRAGARPATSRPWWEFCRSPTSCCSSAASSTTTRSCTATSSPYYVRVGDTWTKIDYSASRRARLDEAAGARRGDRPHRDPGELVPRRPAADDVHQDEPQQPRLRQPARHRADVARPVRLGLPRDGLRGVHDDHPPRRLRPAAGAARCSSGSSSTSTPTRACAGRPSTRSPTTSPARSPRG